jgi:hypothetical protein
MFETIVTKREGKWNLNLMYEEYKQTNNYEISQHNNTSELLLHISPLYNL